MDLSNKKLIVDFIIERFLILVRKRNPDAKIAVIFPFI